ncbi:uncharacterized protein EV154DRAFT_494977 [Mucor mucedo]|uniref:Uncharacterized protein n=1 Tax=Mucor saturninus TaxID=64648 RepID=A0A8H7RFJ0_9FUNG|nr:uncharacterized protein EV154DRAFT_494977 [Mucor mucedo]KAG2209545.1 hypothetical protein INT47_008389 [Mucor saturninus]KAI7895456.1 hypothetical protein EV154DRAFT_494977 [Mucor mucedo]
MTNSNYQEFDEKLMFMYTQTRFCDEDESSVEGELLQVTQNLGPEQYQFEFPTKSCLKALAYLDDDEEEISYFDESSFISSTTIAALSSVDYFDQDTTTMISHMDNWHETHHSDDDDDLVDDGRLSPLQLPAQVNKDRHRAREIELCSNQQNAQSEDLVGPSTFLSESKPNVTPYGAYSPLSFIDSEDEEEQNLRVYCNETEPIMDSDLDSSVDSSVRTTESRNVIIKLNKFNKFAMTIVQESFNCVSSDEGYDDTVEEGELESEVEYYPLCEKEDQVEFLESKRDQAAIKIQSVWRGYISRRENKLQYSSLRADQRVIVNLAQLCGRNYRRQMNQVDDRLYQLEQRVREETRMRMTFEKAMEDMAVAIDQQQKILYDRLEQEVHMRQVYEAKMNAALTQLQPLEARLRKEVSARGKMEEMMTRVLDQMHETETSRQQQVKEDAESKRQMQNKLDQAFEEIALIKKQQPITTSRASSRLQKNNDTSTSTNSIKKENSTSRVTRVRKSIIPASNKLDVTTRQQQQRLTISNSNNMQVFERPSVIPSNRRPVLGSTTKQRTSPITNTSTTPTSRRPLLSRK